MRPFEERTPVGEPIRVSHRGMPDCSPSQNRDSADWYALVSRPPTFLGATLKPHRRHRGILAAYLLHELCTERWDIPGFYHRHNFSSVRSVEPNRTTPPRAACQSHDNSCRRRHNSRTAHLLSDGGVHADEAGNDRNVCSSGTPERCLGSVWEPCEDNLPPDWPQCSNRSSRRH